MLTYFLVISFGMLLIALNIYAMTNINDKLIKWVSIICTSFAFTRYIALIAFAISSSSHNLKTIAPFIFSSTIGIEIPTAFSVFNLYCKNSNKGMKFSSPILFLILTPLIIFYMLLIIYAPKEVVQSQLGFTVELNHVWIIGLSVVQTIFASSIIFSAGKLFIESKRRAIVLKGGLLAATYLMLLVDGILRALNVNNLPFAYIEVIALLSLLGSFQNKKP